MPCFSRSDLETHAAGHISDLFGPQFKVQDEHAVQVRMPEPPLLLADRVVGLEQWPGRWAWHGVDRDRRARGLVVPAPRIHARGIMIEAGQADLFLISYLGVDGLNRGQRRYRLSVAT